MTKSRKKLIHIHSNVANKVPSSNMLEKGELAINYAKEGAFISTVKDDGTVTTFSEDETLVNWMELKSVIPYSGAVEDVDLDKNTSKIGIKLNQVVAASTPKSKDVNSTLDSIGNESAGFKIDMSKYAMQGANPSFSSVTATEQIKSEKTTTLEGTSVINGDLDVNGGDIDIDGDTVTIHRKATSALTAETVDGALEETLEKSKVTVTKNESTNKYEFFQGGKDEGHKLGEISGISPAVNGTGSNSVILGGSENKAEAENSMAGGLGTIATNNSELAVGKYNESTTRDDSKGQAGTLFSVGNGSGNGNRKNALEVMDDGDIYLYVNDKKVCLNDVLSALIDQEY